MKPTNQTKMANNIIDLARIIEHYGLDASSVAAELFPDNKFPRPAFDRLVRGESSLTVEQFQKLSELIGVPMTDLVSSEKWTSETRDGFLFFVKGDYKVRLSHKGVFLTVFKNDKFLTQVIQCPSMSLSDFTEYIDNLISEYE